MGPMTLSKSAFRRKPLATVGIEGPMSLRS